MNKNKYYLKNREKIIEKAKLRYAEKNERKYKRYYLVKRNGKEYRINTNKELAEFLGYSVNYVDHLERITKKLGCDITKVY